VTGSVRRASAVALLAAMLAGCGVPPALRTPVPEAVVVVTNHDTHSVEVAWTGGGSGHTTIEACTGWSVPLAPGVYAFSVRSATGTAILDVPIQADDGGIVREIGVGPDGTIGFGAPAPNPRCAVT
jgi:hypothetical protein